MPQARKRFWPIIVLFLLTICGLFSAGQTVFDIWMTAYPYAGPGNWATRAYFQLAVTIVIWIAWILIVVRMIRRARTQSRTF